MSRSRQVYIPPLHKDKDRIKRSERQRVSTLLRARAFEDLDDEQGPRHTAPRPLRADELTDDQ